MPPAWVRRATPTIWRSSIRPIAPASPPRRLPACWMAGSRPRARIIVELAARDALDVPEGYALEQERRYGAARFVFLRTG